MTRAAHKELIDQVVALWRDGRSVGGILLEIGRPLLLLARAKRSDPARLVLALVKNRRRRDPSIPPAMYPTAGFDSRGYRARQALLDQRAAVPLALGNAVTRAGTP